MRKRRRKPKQFQPVEVALVLAGIPCVVTGIEIRDPQAAPSRQGIRRLWYRITGEKTGMLFAPEWLGLRGWLDVELRAEAAYRSESLIAG